MKKLIILAILALSTRADCLPRTPALSAFYPTPSPGSVIIQAIHVVLTWTEVKTERYYLVQRIDGIVWVTLATLPHGVTTYTDWQPSGAAYRVLAVNLCGAAISNISVP